VHTAPAPWDHMVDGVRRIRAVGAPPPVTPQHRTSRQRRRPGPTGNPHHVTEADYGRDVDRQVRRAEDAAVGAERNGFGPASQDQHDRASIRHQGQRLVAGVQQENPVHLQGEAIRAPRASSDTSGGTPLRHVVVGPCSRPLRTRFPCGIANTPHREQEGRGDAATIGAVRAEPTSAAPLPIGPDARRRPGRPRTALWIRGRQARRPTVGRRSRPAVPPSRRPATPDDGSPRPSSRPQSPAPDRARPDERSGGAKPGREDLSPARELDPRPPRQLVSSRREERFTEAQRHRTGYYGQG